jgi:hypothetical protein
MVVERLHNTRLTTVGRQASRNGGNDGAIASSVAGRVLYSPVTSSLRHRRYTRLTGVKHSYGRCSVTSRRQAHFRLAEGVAVPYSIFTAQMYTTEQLNRWRGRME